MLKARISGVLHVSCNNKMYRRPLFCTSWSRSATRPLVQASLCKAYTYLTEGKGEREAAIIAVSAVEGGDILVTTAAIEAWLSLLIFVP